MRKGLERILNFRQKSISCIHAQPYVQHSGFFERFTLRAFHRSVQSWIPRFEDIRDSHTVLLRFTYKARPYMIQLVSIHK